MPLLSYGRAMAWLAERDANGVAIVHEQRRVTRAELERRSNRLARAYTELGVRAGDLVTLALPNGVEFFEACLATWKLGATPQPISSRLPELERRAIVELAQPRAGGRASRPASTARGRAYPPASSPTRRSRTRRFRIVMPGTSAR